VHFYVINITYYTKKVLDLLQTMQICLLMVLIGVSALRLSAGSIDVVFNDNRFGTIDDTTGSFSQIATLPISAAGGIAGVNGQLFLDDFANNLLRVDPATGQSTYIGNTGLTTNVGAFGGGSAGLFEVDYTSNLYSINSATGQATLIGATGLGPNNGLLDTSLSFDGTSLLYTAGGFGQNDELYLLNAVTAIAIDLGSTGVTGIAGSAFVDGTLELYQYGQSVNYVFAAPDGSVNFTPVAQLGTQTIDGGVPADFNSADTSDAISRTTPLTARTPEPATQALIGMGLTALGMLRWRRRRTGQKSRQTLR
jgi:hypothetical protein